MNESSQSVLEENVDRMVRRWADPVFDPQVDRSCRAFVERLSLAEGEPANRGARLWGAALVAASLLFAVMVFWAIV